MLVGKGAVVARIVGCSIVSVVVFWCVVVSPALASLDSNGDDPVIMLERAGGIAIDGVFEEVEWGAIAGHPVAFEIYPGDNVDPPVETTIKYAIGSEYFYIAVMCSDDEMANVVAPRRDRDDVREDIDYISIYLDTRNDKRSAQVYKVSASGDITDGIYNEASGNEDMAPDRIWQAAVGRDENAWRVEVGIPITSLQFDSKSDGEWGVIVMRNYPRQYTHQICSVKVPRGGDYLLRYSSALKGARGSESSSRVIVMPYLSAGNQKTVSAGEWINNQDIAGSTEVGCDIKWRPDENNTYDVTVNPDFSHLEADEAQISENRRFALYYTEKRPFFMEAVDLLDMPINAVHTRTITSPIWGVRATGQIESAEYTAIVARDGGGGSEIVPGPEYSEYLPQDEKSVATILRARKGLGNSYIGALVSSRELDDGGYNRVYGADCQWSISKQSHVVWQYLRSETSISDDADPVSLLGGKGSGDHAISATYAFASPVWNVRSSYNDYGDRFRADNGYVPQVGYRQLRQSISYSLYDKGILAKVEPAIIVKQYWDRHGARLASNVWPGLDMQGVRGLYGALYYNRDQERVDGLVLTRRQIYYMIALSPGRVVSNLNLWGTAGQAYDFTNARVGNGGDVVASAEIQLGHAFGAQVACEYQWVNSQRGSNRGRLYEAGVARLNCMLFLSTDVHLRCVLQWTGLQRDLKLHPDYVDRYSGDFNTSLLFAYKPRWMTSIYVGYGRGWEMHGYSGNVVPVSREVFIKASYSLGSVS